MKSKYALLVILFYLLHQNAGAQKKYIDTSQTFTMVKLGFGLQSPSKDMEDRFGNNAAMEGEFAFKLRSNIYMGLKGSFLFGNDVKQNDILNGIKTSNDKVIDNVGELTTVFFDQRGYSLFLTAGKIFPVLSPNENSGFLVTVGGGILQHKIRIEFRDSKIPQLEKEYRKGYDHLSNGPAIHAFVGYIYFGKKRLINFYAGFDYIQAWTENRRGYNYNDRDFDNEKRLDVLSGFKFGWVLPLYQKRPNEFYYY